LNIKWPVTKEKGGTRGGEGIYFEDAGTHEVLGSKKREKGKIGKRKKALTFFSRVGFWEQVGMGAVRREGWWEVQTIKCGEVRAVFQKQ